jgi:hypothetical protein
MVKIELHDLDAGLEPAPSFATDADIALAQRLRRQLEERYFGSSAAPPVLEARSSEVH